MERWHSMTARQVMEKLDSGPEGLSDGEAARRLERDGPNQLSPPRRPPLLLRLLGQLQDPMILVLLAAAGLSLAASGGRDWLDGAIILIIVAVNGVLSVTQEDHAHQALEQLRDLSAPMALVIRSGKEKRLPAAALAVGDVILLQAGDQVPADARLLESTRLRADESAMTGESAPVEKSPREGLDPDTPLGDRANRRAMVGPWWWRWAWTPRWAASPGCCWRRERARHPFRRKWPRYPRPCPSCAWRCAG